MRAAALGFFHVGRSSGNPVTKAGHSGLEEEEEESKRVRRCLHFGSLPVLGQQEPNTPAVDDLPTVPLTSHASPEAGVTRRQGLAFPAAAQVPAAALSVL